MVMKVLPIVFFLDVFKREENICAELGIVLARPVQALKVKWKSLVTTNKMIKANTVKPA